MQKIYVDSDSKVDEALELLSKETLLSCDTETSGLSIHQDRLWSVQLGTQNASILFPFNALSEESRNKLRNFTADKTLICHSAKFDYKFLYINGFNIKETYCTQEVERVLFAGKYFTFGLKDVLKRRFQIEMDKEVREVFYSTVPHLKSEFQLRVDEVGEWAAWTDDVIEYALEDICYLHEIYYAQQEDIKQLGMQNVVFLENHLVPVVGKMEKRGVYMDTEATKKFHSRILKRCDELKANLFAHLEKSYNISWHREYTARMQRWDSWKSSHELVVKESNKLRKEGDRRKKTDEGLEMVAKSLKKQPYSTVPKLDNPFSPSSPTKMCLALTEATGFPVTTTSKDWLDENRHLHESIDDLAEFRKYEKLCQFCELTDDINPVTGMIHASFHQNGTKSGRFSCSNPNLQQIPARGDEAKEFRALFRPKKGYKFVGADLAGIELVILAYFAGETLLINAINDSLDVHCFTMSLFLNCPYEVVKKAKEGENLDDEEFQKILQSRVNFENAFTIPELAKLGDLTKWVNTLRDYTKTLTYGLAYDLSAWGLSRKFHCNYEDAESFIALFFSNYPNLKKFLNHEQEIGFDRKYAVNPLGRRRWFTPPFPKTAEKIEQELIKKIDKEKRLWDSISDEEWDSLWAEAVKEADKEYKGKIGYIKRQAGNFFPQSMCADMIKLAMVKFDREFATEDPNEGLFGTIHDELLANIKEENAERGARVMEESMVYAVKKFMPEIETKVQAKIMDKWEK